MISVSVRELLHRFSHYLTKVESGEKIVVLKRNIPVADLTRRYENIEHPAWKRKINRIHLKGVSLSKTVTQARVEER